MLDPAQPTPTPIPCPVCRAGCACRPEDLACGHYGCWSRQAPLLAACPGAEYEVARYETQRRQQTSALALRRNRAASARRALLAAMPPLSPRPLSAW